MKTFEFKRYFPHATVRKEQEAAINFALDSFINQGKRFVILEMGTGCGKSATAVTISRYMTDHAVENDQFEPKARFLTTQKVLQDQYIRDFGKPAGYMSSIKSSTNYKCKFYTGQSCGESLRILKGEAKGTAFFRSCAGLGCTYKKQKQDFLEASEGVTNFPYFLAGTNYTDNIKPAEMLVVDEAHTTEIELSKFYEVTISERFCNSILDLDMPRLTTQKKSIDWVKDIYRPKLSAYINDMKDKIEQYKGLEDKVTEVRNLAKQFETLDKHICKVDRFVEIYDQDNWVYDLVEPDGRAKRKLEFKPVDVSKYAEDLLFKQGKHVLLMSATILNVDAFCESLGIKRDDVAFLSIPSPFPLENRPVVYLPVGKMGAADINKTLPVLAETVKEILKEHKGEKGVIHCHTFKIANYLKKNIKDKRLLVHDSTNREKVLKRHISSKKPTVFVSPSSTEGIDLEGDASRFQIICKLAFPYLGDKLVKKRMSRHSWWYAYQTAKTMIQSLGRSIRSKDDHAVSYILDGNWGYFYKKNEEMFPESFKDALHM